MGLGIGLIFVCWMGAGGPAGFRPALPQDRPIAPWPAGQTPARIVAFGTSLTLGNPWPDRLAQALSACFGHPVEMIRVADYGQDSGWALTQIDRVVAAAPDVVLIEFAINDADLRDGVSPAQGRARHDALVAQLAAALPETRLVMMTMSPAYGLRGLLRPRLAQHYQGVRALAEAAGLGLADLTPRWRGQPRPADGLHPDAAATRQVIDPVLLGLFGQATGRVCPAVEAAP